MLNYTDVTEQDFEELNNLYLEFVKDTQTHIMEHPELIEVIDTFIKKSGEATKSLLMRYRQSEYVAKLGEDDWKEKHQDIKRKNVKLNLAANKLLSAAHAYKVVKESE